MIILNKYYVDDNAALIATNEEEIDIIIKIFEDIYETKLPKGFMMDHYLHGDNLGINFNNPRNSSGWCHEKWYIENGYDIVYLSDVMRSNNVSEEPLISFDDIMGGDN